MPVTMPIKAELMYTRCIDLSHGLDGEALSSLNLSDEPLVSLEDSVKPILHLFTSLMTYVSMAKQCSSKPANELSEDESASVYLYTMEFEPGPSLYRELNAYQTSSPKMSGVAWYPRHRFERAACYWQGDRLVGGNLVRTQSSSGRQ